MPFDLHGITGVAENPCKNVQAEQASLPHLPRGHPCVSKSSNISAPTEASPSLNLAHLTSGFLALLRGCSLALHVDARPFPVWLP